MMAYFKQVCKDCTKRKLRCHGTCKEYLEAKAEHEILLEKERAARKADLEARDAAFLMKRG